MQSFFDFINEHPSAKRLRVNDLLLVEYQCPVEAHKYDIWSHHNYFVYVLSSKKKWLTRHQELLVKEGDCLFVRKGAHTVGQYFDDVFCAIVLFVPDSYIRSVLLENRINTGSQTHPPCRDAFFTVDCCDELGAYFHSFYTYLKASDRPSTALMELKFKELIILSAVRGGNKNLNHYYASLCQSNTSSLRELMEGNYNYPMSLEEYARLCHRSLSAFKRDFKAAFGTTPGRWLLQKRLELARYLLENTDKTVFETALEAGFTNHSHFSRVFKKEFGATPLHLAKVNKSRQ